MSAITKFFIAALAAGVVSALPQNGNGPNSSMVTMAKASSTTTSAAPAATSNANAALIAQLKDAPTAVDRFNTLLLGPDGKLLSGDALRQRTVFDFNDKPTKSAGGALKAANINTFPILTDLDIATTVVFLGPCGINTPHTHPRATEFLTVVEGSVDTGFVLENNFATEVPTTLQKFQGTVFPMGSIHFQVNNNCAPATFVATLNSEDPGTSQIAQNFFALNSGVVNATLGFPATLDGKDIDKFRASLPANLALGVDKCLAKCGIKKSN